MNICTFLEFDLLKALTTRREFDFYQVSTIHPGYAGRKIYFDASSYSKRTYARFRPNLALEHFVSAPHTAGRDAPIRWACAWLLVAQGPTSQRT